VKGLKGFCPFSKNHFNHSLALRFESDGQGGERISTSVLQGISSVRSLMPFTITLAQKSYPATPSISSLQRKYKRSKTWFGK